MLRYTEINIKIHLLQTVKSPKTIDGIYSVTLPVTITVTVHCTQSLKSNLKPCIFGHVQFITAVCLCNPQVELIKLVQFQETDCSVPLCCNDVVSIECAEMSFRFCWWCRNLQNSLLCRSIKWRHMLWMVMGQHTVNHKPCDPSKIVTYLTHWPVACSGLHFNEVQIAHKFTR